GKLQVSAEILNKAGPPDDLERESLRLHPLFGEALVAPLREWLGEWIDAVGHHHERWDGTGYPRGLAEDEIPLAGRIVAIADAYDVITSARSYKKPSRASEARSELVRSAGTHFDPRLVRAFVGMSLGRMRLVVGPLAWLSHAPLLARIPLTQSAGATLGGVAAVAATTAAVATGPAVVGPATASTPPVAAKVQTRPAPSTPLRTPVIRPRPEATPKPKLRPPANREPEPRTKPRGENAPASPPETARTPPESSPPPGSGNGGDDPKPTPPEPSPPVPTPEPKLPAPTPEPPAPIPEPKPPAPTPELPAPPPPANAPPSFVAGGAQVVLEDAGAQATAWASSISPGPPASDAGQTVRFDVSTDNSGLFAAQPAVAADGTLSYTPAPEAYGAATVSVTARDDGGTANQGVDASAPASFTITVSPVNDAPEFSLGGSQTALSALGRQSVPGFASSISCGPPNESGQDVSFVVSVDKPNLFRVAPTISPDGTLSYTPKLLGLGVATVTVVAVDSGGTEHGGRDTSGPRTFTIVVV
ncbi:MAG TPA: HD domain-containing phosphohydrolase, partial [Gaiellaceae bacterium]|nr:HD domain-containing phosphohydrolase [Gaiellaceae bacterium]